MPPLPVAAFLAVVAALALVLAVRRISRRTAQARLLASELERLNIGLPQIDLDALAGAEPVADPDKPPGSAIVHTASDDVHMFRLANVRGIEVQVIKAGILLLTAIVVAIVIAVVSPVLFLEDEKAGNFTDMMFPLIAIVLLYMAFRVFREGLMARSGRRYLVVDRNFLFVDEVFWFLKTQRIFALRYVKNLRADQGVPAEMRALVRFRRPSPRFAWPCLAFDYDQEKVMIAGVDPAEAAWLKGKIEQR